MVRDIHDVALSNELNYDYLYNIESILKSMWRLPTIIEDKGNSTLICINMDFINAIANANLSEDELGVLERHFNSGYVLEDTAWMMDKSVGKISELKQSLLKKIYKELNGCAFDKLYHKPKKTKRLRKLNKQSKKKIVNDKYISSKEAHYSKVFNECKSVADRDRTFKDLYQNCINNDIERDIILDAYLEASNSAEDEQDWISVRTLNRWNNAYEVEYNEDNLNHSCS